MDVSTSRENDEQLKLGLGNFCLKGSEQVPSLAGEVAAGCQENSLVPTTGKGQRRDLGAWRISKIHDVKGFLEVQFARFAVGVETPVVEHAVGEVGVLLNLAEDHPGTDGVRSARGKEERVASGDGVSDEKVFESP